MKELVGVGIACASALLYDVGYVLEKQALQQLPPLRLTPMGVLRTATVSRRWLAGFVSMLVGLGLQVIALTLAPVSVVQPILAGGLIALAAVGSTLLGERLTRRHAVALLLVLVAVVAVGVSAQAGSALAVRVPADRFVGLVVVIVVAAGVAGRAGLAGRSGSSGSSGSAGRSELRGSSGSSGSSGSAGRSKLSGPVGRSARGSGFGRRLSIAGLVGTAVAAGLLYGLGAVSEKAIATGLVRHGLFSGAVSSLGTAYPWIFLAGTLAGMLVFQVGLQAHPASLMASLTNVTSTVCALIGASLVFGEDLLPTSPWASTLRIASFLCVLASVLLLAMDRKETPGPEGPDRARPDHATAP